MDPVNKKKLAFLKLVGKRLDKPRPQPLAAKSEPSLKKTVKDLEGAKKPILESLLKDPLRPSRDPDQFWREQAKSAWTLREVEAELPNPHDHRPLYRWLERVQIPILPRMEMRAFAEFDPLVSPSRIESYTGMHPARRLVAPSDMERVAELWLQAENNDALPQFQDEIAKQLRLEARRNPENLEGPPLW